MTASRLRTFVFVTSALIVAAIGQAQQVPRSSNSSNAAAASSVPAASQPAPKAAAIQATTAQPGNTASTQKPADPSARLIADARTAGFRPTHIRGTLMFCRTAIELGSNFPVRTCYNEQQTKVKLQEYQAQRNQLRSGRFLPPGLPPGCSARSCQ